MKKICFAGLVSERNFGDVVILKSTEYLYKSYLDSRGVLVDYARLDLAGSSTSKSLWYRFGVFYRTVFGCDTRSYKIDNIIRSCKEYYGPIVRDCDVVVVVGGGLIKYKYQRFFMYLVALIEVASEFNVPVVFNSVGVEGYSEVDERCQMLKRSLNMSVIQRISTRDDFHILRDLYIHKDSSVLIDKVPDSAVFSGEAYGIIKEDSEFYGLGLIRGDIFKDNGIEFSSNELACLYSSLIREMDLRGMKYKIFTNGLKSDDELVTLIAGKLGKSKLDYIRPNNDFELVELISKFKAIIASRLHANIIAYSLNVPSVGLVWNDKLKMFGREIGYPERFFEHKDFDAVKMVDVLISSGENGYENNFMISYKNKAKLVVNDFLSEWLDSI